MKDPGRLTQHYSELEVLLIGSAELDVPPRDLHANLNATLLAGASTAVVGAGAGAGAAHTSSGAVQASAVVASGITGTTGAAAVASAAVWKWVGLAVLGGALSLGAHAKLSSAHVATALAPQQATVHESAANPSVGVATRANEPARSIAARSQVSSVTPESVKRALSVVTPSQPVALDHPAPVDDIRHELAVLDEARAALAARDSARVIERLDRHDLDFPNPQLAAEALALRVEAYALKHDRVRVRELAGAFVARYPEHPLIARIRMLAGAE